MEDLCTILPAIRTEVCYFCVNIRVPVPVLFCYFNMTTFFEIGKKTGHLPFTFLSEKGRVSDRPSLVVRTAYDNHKPCAS